MPDLYTSRYANGGSILASQLVPVRVTKGHPRFRVPYKIAGRIPPLAPTPEEFVLTDQGLFTDRYRARMDSLDIDDMHRTFEATSELYDGRGLVLLCFEDLAKAWCHRRVFAEWWQERTGQPVPELDGHFGQGSLCL